MGGSCTAGRLGGLLAPARTPSPKRQPAVPKGSRRPSRSPTARRSETAPTGGSGHAARPPFPPSAWPRPLHVTRERCSARCGRCGEGCERRRAAGSPLPPLLSRGPRGAVAPLPPTARWPGAAPGSQPPCPSRPLPWRKRPTGT